MLNKTAAKAAPMNLYVELATSRIYEGKLFEDFVIVRPILPQFHKHMRKVVPDIFTKEFTDYDGDRSAMRLFLSAYQISDDHPVMREEVKEGEN